MGIILSALAAAGDAGVQSENQNITQMHAQDNEKLRSDLEQAKAMAIMKAQNDLTNAPLMRAQQYIQDASAGQIADTAPAQAAPSPGAGPRDPAAVDLSGGWDSINSSYKAGQGARNATQSDILNQELAKATDPKDIATLGREISRVGPISPDAPQMNLKTPDAAPAAPSPQGTPTMRDKTQPEVFADALKAATAKGDLQAAAAIKAAIPDNLMVLPDSATLYDKTTGKVVMQNNGKEERQNQREDRKDARQSASEDARAERQDKSLAAILDRRDSAGKMTDAMESNAHAIANGQLPPITGFGLRSPGASAIMARVLEINPDYSAKDYGTGAKAEKDFATGKQGNSVRSFNVALSHLDTLGNLADALKNGDVKAVNRLGNFVSTQTGSPTPTNFEAVKHIVADEIVKAVTGSAGALGDREAAAKTIEAASSPAQLKGVIASYKELMVGQINGLRDQYKATTGKDDFDTKYLSDAARAVAHGKTSATNPVVAPAAMPDDIANLMKKYGGQ